MKLSEFGFLLVLFSGFVLADLGDDFMNSFGYVLGGYSGDIVLLKAVMWVLLFAVIFWSLFKGIFHGNRGLAVIIALVISTVGVRFVPEELLDSISGGFYMFILLILLLVLLKSSMILILCK